MPTSSPKRLAYLVSRFPTVTETFILREMIDVERQGMPITLYTLIVEQGGVVHDDARAWIPHLHSIRYGSWTMIKANLIALFTRPLLVIGLLLLTLRELWGSWNFFMRDLFLFPKAIAFAHDMKAQGIDHLHAHWATHTAYTAYIVHRMTGIPYSFTAHAHDIYIWKAMLCRKVRAARFVATISHFNAAELIDDCGEAVRDKIHIVRCGVDVEKFTPEHHATGEPFTILTVAGLRDYKGHPEAIKACKLLKTKLPNFRWLVIGGGPEKAALEALIAEAGVGDVFQLLGPKPEHEVRRLMTEADCFVMTSVMLKNRRMDGIPVALMESLAMEIPTIATQISGIPELVEDGVTGYCVPPENAELLVNAVLHVYNHPEQARRLAATGRQRVEQEFTVRGNAARLVALFQSAPDSQ